MAKRDRRAHEDKLRGKRKRSRLYRWYQIIEQVEIDEGTTDLDNDDFFLALCKALLQAGFDLVESDMVRYRRLLKTEAQEVA